MAKVKKQEKPIEQRLEEALVLYEKTPYEVPSNWCWTKLPYITQIKTGKRDANHAKEDGQYRFYTCSAEYSMTDTYAFEGESIIVPGNGDIGLVFYYDGKFEAYQRTYVINGFKGQTKYLYYYFYYKWREKNTYKQFGTAIPYVRMANFEEFEIPLAPLEEQKRIVEIIEKQFAKLDEARDLIQKSLDSFADRKSAILHKAFTGELTKQWREEKGKSISEWESGELNDVISSIKYGTSEKSEYAFNGIPVVRIPNIQNETIDFNDIKYLNTNEENEIDILKENDILVIRSNGSRDLVGTSSLVPNLGNQIITYASFLIRIRANSKILPQYLVRFLNSSISRDQMFVKAKSSSGIHNINSKEIGGIKISVPSVPEQEEIVRILDSIFEKEDKSKELLDMLDKIDEMKKSILARAFRGQLGTSNPTDEPAEILLKRIIEGGGK